MSVVNQELSKEAFIEGMVDDVDNLQFTGFGMQRVDEHVPGFGCEYTRNLKE